MKSFAKLPHRRVGELRPHLPIRHLFGVNAQRVVDGSVAYSQFRRGLFNCKSVDREDILDRVKFKLKAVCEQLLDHHPKLFGTWLAFCVGFAGNIEFTFANPIRFGWGAVDLTDLHLPGEFDEVVDSVFRKGEVPGSRIASLQCVRRRRLNGGDFKRRVRGRGHRG